MVNMISMMKMVWKCLFSPRLYKIYKDGALEDLYQTQGLEKWGDKIITSATTLFNITLYTSPLICLYVYKRGLFTYDEYKYMANIIGSVSCFLAISFLIRAYGRANNYKYVQFLRSLEGLPNQRHETYMAGIQKYDFDFSAWPSSYIMPQQTSSTWINPFGTTVNANRSLFLRITIQLLAYIATHTFAIRLIYPGSLGFIQSLMWMPLFHGRANLVETFNGQRAKVKTADDNDIDTMFVDNRWGNPNGEILVVCCEGNSGFYEIGVMMSPVKTGYSALGWNHPGFGGSTGLPHPSQEHNAIDAVMQYAINKLGFKPECIVMFGWSIGGYSAAWAAANYPVKAVVLDASFDDLLPLAQNQMPASWSLLVKEVVRSYANLHVTEMLKKYSGPVHLVRRTDDEIICLQRGHNSTNRGNFLLIDLVRQRHPEIVRNHLSLLLTYAHMAADKWPKISQDMPAGEQEVLKRLNYYMRDFRSSHCTPLPDNEFLAIMTHVLGTSN